VYRIHKDWSCSGSAYYSFVPFIALHLLHESSVMARVTRILLDPKSLLHHPNLLFNAKKFPLAYNAYR